MSFFDGILGPVISGGLSLLGGIQRNSAQEAQAQQQMAFQEQMSDTAHQREVADLRAAGLNPMLSAKYGGSSTPPGAMATIQDVMSPAVNSGMAAATTKASIDQMKAQTEKAEAEGAAARADVGLKQSQAALNFTNTGLAEQNINSAQQGVTESKQRVANMVAELPKIMAEADRIAELNHLTREEVRLTRERVIEVMFGQEKTRQEAENYRIKNVLDQLDIPRASNMARAEGTAWKEHVSPFLLDFMRLFNSGASLGRAVR